MFDFGFSQILLTALVALVVLGPEKLPKSARLLGSLFGRARHYIGQVQSEINRTMELDALKQVQQEAQAAAGELRGALQSFTTQAQGASEQVQQSLEELEREIQQAYPPIEPGKKSLADAQGRIVQSQDDAVSALLTPEERRAHARRAAEQKKRALRKRPSAAPQWVQRELKLRQRAQSGAARVARFRKGGRAALRAAHAR